MTGDDDVDAVFIKPRTGTTYWNGISKTLTVTADALMEMTLDTVVVTPATADIDVQVEVTFKKTNGTTSAVATKDFSINEVQDLAFQEFVPSDAATAVIEIGVNNATSSHTVLAVREIEITEDVDPPVSCDPPDCDGCNISCVHPYRKVQDCGQTKPPSCITIEVCYCEDPPIGIGVPQQSSWWDDY